MKQYRIRHTDDAGVVHFTAWTWDAHIVVCRAWAFGSRTIPRYVQERPEPSPVEELASANTPDADQACKTWPLFEEIIVQKCRYVLRSEVQEINLTFRQSWDGQIHDVLGDFVILWRKEDWESAPDGEMWGVHNGTIRFSLCPVLDEDIQTYPSDALYACLFGGRYDMSQEDAERLFYAPFA